MTNTSRNRVLPLAILVVLLVGVALLSVLLNPEEGEEEEGSRLVPAGIEQSASLSAAHTSAHLLGWVETASTPAFEAGRFS